MSTEFTFRRRVQFHETDMAGVVHFSCYFRYLEEAEHAMWRAEGLSVVPRSSDLGFPRVAASLEFRQPLRFEDEFDVGLRVAAVTNKTIRYDCKVTRDGAVVAEGSMTVIAVRHGADGKMTAVPLPENVAAAFRVHADAGR